MRREEMEHRLYPELKPLLTLQIPDSWNRMVLFDGHIVFGVRFYYRDNERDCAEISYWNDSPRLRYQTWVDGCTDERYPTLEEAIKRIKFLMTLVVRVVHYSDIASVRNEEYNISLLECIGIGVRTITRLVDGFGTLQKLRESSIEDIEEVPGIGSDKAWLIASHLYPNVRYHELWDHKKGEWAELYRVPKEVIDQCVRTRTYLTQEIRDKYRLTHKEIKERGLVKMREERK